MLIEKMPYFLKDKDWYYYDMENGKYKLTNKAPQEAIDSYNEYYKKLDGI